MSLSPAARREVRKDTLLRRARTCYGHLAGVLGVELFGALVQRGWIEVGESAPIVSKTGREQLAFRGVPLDRDRDAVARFCTDWTEHRSHLAGPLGRAITQSLVEAGIIVREPGTRVVTMTAELADWLVLGPVRH